MKKGNKKSPHTIIFGGTTEGKKAAATLDGLNMRYFYSTKTRTDFCPSGLCEYIHGALDGDALQSFVEKNQINLIVNAAHPFALHLHAAVARVSKETGAEVIRYSRKYPQRTEHPLAVYCDNYAEAVRKLNNEDGATLILSGVQTLSELKPLWKERKDCYARILPRKTSVSLAIKQGFPENRLITEMPSSDFKKEKALFEKLKIKRIVTKESGDSGGQEAKIRAAIESGAKIAVIKKPEEPPFSCAVSSEKELAEKIRERANVS